MPGVKLTTQAYCKMVLHGAKYPHCAVNGLLVAEKQKPRKEHLPLGGPGAHHTLFVDCIPLFHGTLALAPMLEVALTLVSAGRVLPRNQQGRRSPGDQLPSSPSWKLTVVQPESRPTPEVAVTTNGRPARAYRTLPALSKAPQMAARSGSGRRSDLNRPGCF
ncbi:hypothetical protein J1605_006866 [Eschrichtius robustus]|uniref:ER membrane protein complex subunit 8 n=1 Tax=Eschrichtius robustus TaxID=9764 RepID=A0AB34GZH3_ESCRO|nr:hypothetical protein J1605_006866 [Eschrichtius robustus]